MEELYMRLFSTYAHDQLAHMRPIKPKLDEIDVAKIKKNYNILSDETCPYCGYHDCVCKDCLKCDTCQRMAPMADTTWDEDKSKCCLCNGEEAKSVSLYKQLRDELGYFIHACTHCKSKYLISESKYYNTTDHSQMLLCLECQKYQCTGCQCLGIVQICEKGCCKLCKDCYEIKHEGIKGRSDLYCSQCRDYPFFVKNKYGQLIAGNNCRHFLDH